MEYQRATLPTEKSNEKIDHSAIPYERVIDCIIMYVIRTGYQQWKMLPLIEYDSGSTSHRRFIEVWIWLDSHFQKDIDQVLIAYDKKGI